MVYTPFFPTYRSRKGYPKVLSLPNDLLLEVIANVASNSFHDLCYMRQTCKEFNKFGQDDYIFQHISIDKAIPLFPWKEEEEEERFSEFLNRCTRSGNAEALYRQGVIRIFDMNRHDFESGFECLKNAAARGHREATYLHGVVLACVGGEGKQQGLESLCNLNREDLSESRERIKNCRRSMWVNKGVARMLVPSTTMLREQCSQCGNLQDNFAKKLRMGGCIRRWR